MAMAELACNQDAWLSEHPILAPSPTPAIADSIIYDNYELHNQVEVLLEKMVARSPWPELHQKYSSGSLESVAVTNSSGSSLPLPTQDSFHLVNCNDRLGTGNEYVRSLIYERLQHCPSFHEEDEDDGIIYIENTHPVYRLNTMPYDAVRDLQRYGSVRTEMNGFACDGPFDKRSPELAARISPFTGEKQPLGLGQSRSITFKDLTEFRTVIKKNDLGNTADKDNRSWIEPQHYLKLTDHFRETIEKDVAMYDDELDMLSTALQEISNREIIGESPLPFPTIVYSRLEKLLKSIIHHPGKGQLISQPNFKNLVHLAVAIECKWHMRYKDNLFSISAERLSFMVTYGILAHVSIKSSTKGDGSASWVTGKRWRGAGTDLLGFPIGHWWPNTACAVRDGAVNLTKDKTISGHQLVTYISLLTGIEKFDNESGFMKYVLESKLENIFLYLQGKVGTKIRLIRGYKLKSLNAPKMGIRYDGTHVLKQFGLKLLDKDRSQYRMVLYYDAIEGESGINNNDFMKPSTRDDWDLYKRFEKEEMKKHCSQAGYHIWQTGEEEELTKCQEWHRREKLRVHAENLYI